MSETASESERDPALVSGIADAIAARLRGALAPTTTWGLLWPLVAVALASALVLGAATLFRSYVYVVFSDDVYLPIHYFAEIASVVLSFAIFAVYWHAARELEKAQGLFIGTAFLAVALLDAMHALSFPGMPRFVTASSVDKGILYWLAARLWASITLLIAAFVRPTASSRFSRRWLLLALNLALPAAVFVVVSFYPAYLPPMYVPDYGLTGLKVGLEYLVVALSVAGVAVYVAAYLASRSQFLKLLGMALVVTVFSELSFTLYAAAYDTYNLLGHVYKVIAYYLIFSALFVSAVRRPYAELRAAFGELDVKNRELARLNDQIDHQLKRTIAELRETAWVANHRAAQLDAVIESMTEGVSIATADGRVLRVNRVGREILGMPAQQHEGYGSIEGYYNTYALSYPDGRPVPAEERPLRRALGGEAFTDVEVVYSRADGQRFDLLVGGSPVRDEFGSVILAVAIWRDVTAIRELERRREEFLHIVAHDIRSPLTIVLGQAQLIARAAEYGQRSAIAQAAEAIATSARQMNAMISSLVDSARVEAGQLTVDKQVVGLGPFLTELLARAEAAVDVERVRVECPADLAPVLADPALLERILMNLIGNALKYSPPEAEVTVSLAQRNGEVVVSVADRGEGIAPEELSRLFERYYRAEQGRRHREGLGLGLYITRGLVEAHGGRIWAASEGRGRGATFSFTLPVACPVGLESRNG